MAVPPDDHDHLNLPEIPHERAEQPGRPHSVLKSAHIERKGIRYHQLNEYHDPALGSALGLVDRTMTGDDPAFIREWLIERANAVLRKAGELDYSQVLGTVEDSKAPTGVEGMDAGLVALFINFAKIIARRGYLSRESNAARFLALNDQVGSVIGPNVEKWEVMMEWADAWYWLRLEESTAHYLAVEGAKAIAGRATSAPKRAEQKKIKLQFIAHAFAAYCEQQKRLRRPVNRTAAAGEILDIVNSQLAQFGWAPYTEQSLRILLSKLPERNARPTVTK